MTDRGKRRIHACRHDTPLRHTYVKQPSRAWCAGRDCHWSCQAADGSREELLRIRSLATHHAKKRKHHVTVQLAQVIHMVPREENDGHLPEAGPDGEGQAHKARRALGTGAALAARALRRGRDWCLHRLGAVQRLPASAQALAVRQTVCDDCGKPVESRPRAKDQELIRVYIEVGGKAGSWHEYHRACGMRLTVAGVDSGQHGTPL